MLLFSLESVIFRFAHDADGNETERIHKATGAARRLFWDAESQLVRVEIFTDGLGQPATSVVLYFYDALGRRIGRSVDGVVTLWVYDDEDVLLELDGVGNVLDPMHLPMTTFYRP